MPVQLRLEPTEAKLVFLALAYHLARPGSELDPETKTTVRHGLAEVSAALQPQLRKPIADVALRAYQLERLGIAVQGAVNELKVYPMLEARPPAEGGGRRSAVPGFDQTLRHLFPEVEEDAEEASALVVPLMALRRRLDAAHGEAAEEERRSSAAPRRAWWRFWRQTGGP